LSVLGTPTLFGIDASQPKAGQFALGYVYNLSKRTAVYATFSYVENKNGAALGLFASPAFYTGTITGGVGAAVPAHAYGYDLGIRHAF
jgi:predicted porin